MSLLDQKMRADLQERLNGREISAAVDISKAIKDGVSTVGLPSYFFGDRAAKSVTVNLNPGEATDICDNNWRERTGNFGSSIDSFITDYAERQRTYGEKFGVTPKGKADSFDVKQAAFLTPWVNSGIDLSSTPDWSDEEYCLEAKTKVICNKLQLELVPYASAKFDIIRSEIARFRPFVTTLLDEIFANARTYIIFQSAKFEAIFMDYNKAHPGTFTLLPLANTGVPLKDGGTLHGRCRVVKINYNGKSCNALIAHTFPNQGLSKAYDLMQKYGRFCYTEFHNSTIKK